MIDLKEIEDRANAATKGPWSKSDSLVTSNEGLICATCFVSVTSFQIDLNAKFISHAREDIPALIARVRELESDKTKLYLSVAALSEEIDTLCERADALGIENAQLRAGITELQTQAKMPVLGDAD